MDFQNLDLCNGKSQVRSWDWSEGVLSRTPNRVKWINHCMDLQNPGPCSVPSCVQLSTKPHKSASYWSPLVSSAPFEEGCKMTMIPPQSRLSDHMKSGQ